MSHQPQESVQDRSPSQGQMRLSPHQIQMIEEALAGVGDFGEVHLIVQKGRLRFLVTQKSLDVLKWQPGTSLKRA